MGEMPCCGLSRQPASADEPSAAQLDQQRLVRVAADVDVLSRANRRHDDRAAGGLVRHRPILAARFRIDGAERVGPRQEQLPLAAGLDDRGRRVALLGRRRRSPDLGAGVLVERHGVRAIAAGEADELVAVDERMAGVAPHRRLRVVFLRQILLPNDFARVGLEADEIALGAERVDLVAVDDRRAARAGRVRDRVLHRVLVVPLLLAGRLVEAQHALDAGEFLAVEVVDFHVVVGDVVGRRKPCRRPRPARRIRPPPARATRRAGRPRETSRRRPVFAPHVVALRPHPLRPIVGAAHERR